MGRGGGVCRSAGFRGHRSCAGLLRHPRGPPCGYPRAAQHDRARAWSGHGWRRHHRGGSGPPPRAGRCPCAGRPPRQGSLHPGADHGARGRRAGQSQPRATQGRRRPRWHACRRRGPPLGPAGHHCRPEGVRSGRSGGLRHDGRRALPADFSRTVAGLRESEWLAACISVGQAYGGDLEAVNVHTGLLAAHLVVGADVAVVAQGPGNLGTGTRWGFSGTSAGEAVNAAGVLGGRPIASLRVSEADQRAEAPWPVAPQCDGLRAGRPRSGRRPRPGPHRGSRRVRPQSGTGPVRLDRGAAHPRRGPVRRS